MSPRRRTAGFLGVGFMVLGAMGPWADMQTLAGAVSVDGLDHGAEVVIGCAALAALTMLTGWSHATALCAAVAAGWTALVMYTLPGSLVTGTAWQADMAWGAYLALVGALVLLVATLSTARHFDTA